MSSVFVESDSSIFVESDEKTPPTPLKVKLEPSASTSSLSSSSDCPVSPQFGPTDLEARMAYPRSKINVLLMESVHQSAVDNLVSRGFNVETAHLLSAEELAAKLEYTHMIGVRSKTKLTADILRAAKKLMCVGCFCIGTDQTDLSVATDLGIPVFNSPFANTRSVAEMIIGNIISLSRRLGDQNILMHKGIWKKTATGCFEIRGKTLGLIGYGQIGSQVSIMAEAMGMSVVYYDIVPKLPLGNARAARCKEEVLAAADFVSLHVPLTADTKGIISAPELALMKPGSYLLNAARGKCADVSAVAACLKSGHLAGAFFDVFPFEPTDVTNCLIECPNTILSPHIGGSTLEAQASIADEVSSKMMRFIDEGCTIASVNFPHVSMRRNPAAHRLLHVHKNVPGVMRKVLDAMADYNVTAQALQTNAEIGIMLIEVDADHSLSKKVRKVLSAMPESIKCRVIHTPDLL